MMTRADENQTNATHPDKVTPLSGARRVHEPVTEDSTPSSNLADAGIDLDALKEAISHLPEVDATRAMNLFNRIQAGDYEVDPATVADKLLFLERQLQQEDS